MLYLGIDQHIRQIPNSLRDENGDVERLSCARRSARPPLFSICDLANAADATSMGPIQDTSSGCTEWRSSPNQRVK
jgi:hypothetical protein